MAWAKAMIMFIVTWSGSASDECRKTGFSLGCNGHPDTHEKKPHRNSRKSISQTSMSELLGIHPKSPGCACCVCKGFMVWGS